MFSEDNLLRDYAPYPFDLDAARREMALSAYDRNGDGVCDDPACDKVFALDSLGKGRAQTEQVWIDGLKQIGITLEIHRIPQTTTGSLKSRPTQRGRSPSTWERTGSSTTRASRPSSRISSAPRGSATSPSGTSRSWEHAPDELEAWGYDVTSVPERGRQDRRVPLVHRLRPDPMLGRARSGPDDRRRAMGSAGRPGVRAGGLRPRRHVRRRPGVPVGRARPDRPGPRERVVQSPTGRLTRGPRPTRRRTRATPSGATPRWIVSAISPVDASIRLTVPSPLLATQTDPNPTAIPAGPSPTRIVDERLRLLIEARHQVACSARDPDGASADGDRGRDAKQPGRCHDSGPSKCRSARPTRRTRPRPRGRHRWPRSPSDSRRPPHRGGWSRRSPGSGDRSS